MSNEITSNYKFAILNNLLTQKFSKLLLKLEKNSEYHFNVINETKNVVDNITEICEDLIEKMPKFKRNSVVVNNNFDNSVNNNYRSSSINRSEKTPTKNLTSKNLLGSKTPLIKNNNNKSMTKNNNTNNSNNSNKNNSDLTKSKSNLNLLKGRTTEKPANFVNNNSKNNNNNNKTFNTSTTLNKTKSSMNLKNIKIKKDINNTTSNISKDFDNNNPINKSQIKRSKTGARFSLLVPNKLKININSITNNNNIQTSPNKSRKSFSKKNLTSRKRRHTIQNKDNTLKTLNKISNDSNNNNNENDSHNKNRSFNSEEISKFDMESNLIKSQEIFDNNDPLLISPITDNDFIPTDLILNVKEIENNNKTFLSEKFKDDFYYQFENFLKFLNNKEIFCLFFMNKKIKEISIKFLIKKLTNEKNFYLNKIKNIIERNKINDDDNLFMRKNNNIELSKGTKKAITLLNEPIINRLFNEINKIPNSDILLVYKIFFQFIKYKNIIDQPFFNFNENDNDNNNKIFWEKTCNFFAIENNGKTGDLIEKIVNQNKLVLDNKNIYKIIHIINGNIGKIIPSYFTKTCGTTGLIVFFIKDILDYTGISNDKKFWENAYFTYKGIVNVIDDNIEVLKKYN